MKARITKKGDLREWVNDRGSGKLFGVELIDLHGGRISATFFNDAAEQFSKQLDSGKVYTFASGIVKLANKKFTSIKHDFQLTFDVNADICEVRDSGKIPINGYNFTKITAIQDLKANDVVDVVGLVLQISPFSLLALKNGTNKGKKVVTIGDDSNFSIDVTVWGELAEQETFFKQGKIMVFKSARISEYNNRTLNASFDCEDTTMAVPKMHSEIDKVGKWFESSPDIEKMSLDMQPLSFFSAVTGNEIFCSIDEMITLSEKDPEVMEGKKSGFYRINCHLAYIPGVADESRNLIYLACQKCKKKVTDNGEAYFCENCQEAQKEVTPSYIFSAKL